MGNTKLFGLDQSRHTAPSAAPVKRSGIVLASASFDPNGDAGRDANVNKAIEAAGYESPPPELPPVDDSRKATPQEAHEQLEKNIQRYGLQVEQQAKQKYPDWERVVGGSDSYIGQEAQIALLETPNATDTVYFLATHPDIAKRLGKMTPVGAIAEVRRISDSLPKPAGAESRPRRPSQSTIDNATFSELAAMPDYPGKGRDLRRCRG